MCCSVEGVVSVTLTVVTFLFHSCLSCLTFHHCLTVVHHVLLNNCLHCISLVSITPHCYLNHVSLLDHWSCLTGASLTTVSGRACILSRHCHIGQGSHLCPSYILTVILTMSHHFRTIVSQLSHHCFTTVSPLSRHHLTTTVSPLSPQPEEPESKRFFSSPALPQPLRDTTTNRANSLSPREPPAAPQVSPVCSNAHVCVPADTPNTSSRATVCPASRFVAPQRSFPCSVALTKSLMYEWGCICTQRLWVRTKMSTSCRDTAQRKPNTIEDKTCAETIKAGGGGEEAGSNCPGGSELSRGPAARFP